MSNMTLSFFVSDVNECLSDPCDVSAVCTNTNGSFTCTCNDHFRGDGFNCTRICEDGYQLNESSMVCGKFGTNRL